MNCGLCVFFFNVDIIEPLKTVLNSGYYLIKNVSEIQGSTTALLQNTKPSLWEYVNIPVSQKIKFNH